MFPVAYRAARDMIKSYEDAGERIPGGIVDGSINLALSGVVNLYLAGHKPMANKYYQHLRETYPEREAFGDSLEGFVRQMLRKEIQDVSPTFSANYIDGLLRKAYELYGMRDDDLAAAREEHARRLHKVVIEEYADQNDRLMLPTFAKMRWLALKNFFDEFADNRTLKDVKRKDIEKLLKARGTQISPKTYNDELALIKNFFSWSFDQKYML